MKLEDIKSAVKHSAEAEFKRAFYNACAVLSSSDIIFMFNGLYKEVYEADEASSSVDA